MVWIEGKRESGNGGGCATTSKVNGQEKGNPKKYGKFLRRLTMRTMTKEEGGVERGNVDNKRL